MCLYSQRSKSYFFHCCFQVVLAGCASEWCFALLSGCTWNSLCLESQKSHSINASGSLGKGYHGWDAEGMAVSCCSEAFPVAFLLLYCPLISQQKVFCPILNHLEFIASQQHLDWLQGRISWCFKDQLLSSYFIEVKVFLRLTVLFWKNNDHVWFISPTLNSPRATLFLLCTHIY